MSEEIIKVLNDLGNRFGIVIDWTSENVLPYLQDLMTRFIAYENAITITWIVLFVILIILSTIGIKKLKKWSKSDKFDEYGDDGLIFSLSILGLVLLIIISSFVLIDNIHGLYQNIFIPELTIVEYLQNFNV